MRSACDWACCRSGRLRASRVGARPGAREERLDGLDGVRRRCGWVVRRGRVVGGVDGSAQDVHRLVRAGEVAVPPVASAGAGQVAAMSDEDLTLVPALDRPSIDDDDETAALAGRTSSSSVLRSPGSSTPGGRSRSIRWVNPHRPPQSSTAACCRSVLAGTLTFGACPTRLQFCG